MSNGSDKKYKYIPGAPTKYDEKFCEMLIEHMRQGYSFETFGAIVMATKKTLYNWAKEYPEFLHAKKQGTVLSQMHWEGMGNKHAVNKVKTNDKGHVIPGDQLNNGVWTFNMKNRFGWRSEPVMADEDTELEFED